ncbi:MAG: hypothetical protein MRY72_11055 [Aquisalinus sp.]|nr:hypothetical protein [Aquisalinus sp.]
MRIILSSLASAGFLALGGNVLAAEAPKTISDCVEIADNDDRLACFDELAREPNSNPTLSSTITPERAETPAQKERRLFGLRMPQRPQTEENYGLRQPSQPALKEVSTITASVLNVTFSKANPTRDKIASSITLDNGQVWQQVDGDRRYLRKLRDGVQYTAIIERAALGSYRMKIEPMGQIIRVRRIK